MLNHKDCRDIINDAVNFINEKHEPFPELKAHQKKISNVDIKLISLLSDVTIEVRFMMAVKRKDPYPSFTLLNMGFYYNLEKLKDNCGKKKPPQRKAMRKDMIIAFEKYIVQFPYAEDFEQCGFRKALVTPP